MSAIGAEEEGFGNGGEILRGRERERGFKMFVCIY